MALFLFLLEFNQFFIKSNSIMKPPFFLSISNKNNKY